MVSNDLIELRSDVIIMEALHDIALDLPPIERSKYVSVVTEAIVNNPDTQLKIINKLCKQVENLQQIDLEQCNKSMGNITKYHYYNVMLAAMDIINESEITSDIPNVVRMNKLHNILLENADDFIWAYKHSESLIKKAYLTLTRMMFITIDLSISDYIKKLDVSFKFNTKINPIPTKISSTLKDIDRMIGIFENGTWRGIMLAAKKSATKRTMKALDEMNGTEPPASMATEASIGATVGMIFSAPVPVKVIIGVIITLLCYRKITFYVAKAGGAFANFVRHCAELVKAHDACNRNQSESAIEKHNKFYNMMIGVADRIEAFFNKTSASAEKEVSEANKKDFNTNEITQINGMEFEL